MAAHAYSILDGYICGFTLTELRLPFSTSVGAAGVAEIAGSPPIPMAWLQPPLT
jgi:hypothetical protein